MSPVPVGWWVVKRGDEYFAGVVQDDMAVWVTVQNQAWQFPSRPDAHARASDTAGRIVRIRARVPSRGLDFETGLANSKARTA